MLVQSMPEVHMQPLVALALVGLLHMCADTYVSAELAANGQAAGQHARHLSNVLMRLRASVNPETLPELSSDLQVDLSAEEYRMQMRSLKQLAGAGWT